MESPTSAPHSLTELSSRSLPDAVYDVLLEMLMSQEFLPGTPLSIDRISSQLQVSPTPVREALARLESTGLLERQARRGYRVSAPMSVNAMRELVDARLVLEVGALERALSDKVALAAALTRALSGHEMIGQQLIARDGAFDAREVREYFERDWEFHQAILDHCGNRFIERSVNSLAFSVHRMRQTIGVGYTDAAEAISEHKAILDAVNSGDDDDALDALRQHLMAVGARSGAAL